MRGFTDRALVILPRWSDFQYRNTLATNHLKRALDNIFKWLKYDDIMPVFLSTDETALHLVNTDVTWARTTNDGDTYFIEQNCLDMDKHLEKCIDYPVIWSEALKKYPNKRGQSIESRLEDVIKRESYSANKIIKEFRLVVAIGQNYRVNPKVEDQKLYVIVDDVSFLPKTFMSGAQIDPCRLLGFNSANHPVYDWEIKDGQEESGIQI